MVIKMDVNQRINELVKRHSSNYFIDQNEIKVLCEEFKPVRTEFIPNEKNEDFVLVSNNGEITGVTAPRWLCHLIGLRHTAAHVVLHFKAKAGSLYLLQVRSWEKSDSPGHLDISVGGHVKCGSTPQLTAIEEMNEEVGFELNDIVNHKLLKILEYSTYNSSGNWFHNNEWCEVFEAELNVASLSKLQFLDGEVVGTHLCPQSELSMLLKQKYIPIAPALRNFIIHYLKE
jgi:isopentenyldiphosphate isomerase